MKTSAPIITLSVVGALVMLVFLSHLSDSGDAPSAEPPVAEMALAASTSAPALVKAPAKVRTRAASINSPARINIPRLHLKVQVGRSVDKGPAWWPVTGRPGGGDTIAIAGHRTTHTHPFLNLDRLEPGNAIYVRWQGVGHRYVVSGRRILSQRQLHIGDARGHEILLLTACTPKGSSRQRIVVYAWPEGRSRSLAS